jgi:hypothetical protein
MNWICSGAFLMGARPASPHRKIGQQASDVLVFSLSFAVDMGKSNGSFVAAFLSCLLFCQPTPPSLWNMLTLLTCIIGTTRVIYGEIGRGHYEGL